MALACSDLGISPPLGGRSFNGDGERVRRRGTEEKRKGSRSDFFSLFLFFFFRYGVGGCRAGWVGPDQPGPIRRPSQSTTVLFQPSTSITSGQAKVTGYRFRLLLPSKKKKLI